MGALATSRTRSGRFDCATSPTTPSPGFTRTRRITSSASPRARAITKSAECSSRRSSDARSPRTSSVATLKMESSRSSARLWLWPSTYPPSCVRLRRPPPAPDGACLFARVCGSFLLGRCRDKSRVGIEWRSKMSRICVAGCAIRSGSLGDEHGLGRGLGRADRGLERDGNPVSSAQRDRQGQREDVAALGSPCRDRGRSGCARAEDPGLPGFPSWGCGDAHNQVCRPLSGYDHGGPRVRIYARWRESHHATVYDASERTLVGVGLLPSGTDNHERHDQEDGEGKWQRGRKWAAQESDDAIVPARRARDAGVAMTQHDPGTQASRRLDLHGSDRGGLVERLFELREVALAFAARLEMRRNRLAFIGLERAEHISRQVFGHVTFLAHRSSSRLSRSLFIARRTRLLTVPSGVPVRAAISLCE